ncbi:hypothetical protein F4781DRAFT_162700 [Annulohypoxylon bovei var. microspora]|nr:hypothetical protein F4781DRAFT_162700 [Annulohypoxylon bovei var. microspora]
MALVTCNRGHQHFGKYGLAGLLIHRYRDTGEVEMLLGRRVERANPGLSYDAIEGAIEEKEIAHDCVRRKAEEEIGIKPGDILIPTAMWDDDHGNWSHTTIFATPARGYQMPDFKLNHEIEEVVWLTRRELDNVPLNMGFELHIRNQLNILLPPDIDPVTGNIVRYESVPRALF